MPCLVLATPRLATQSPSKGRQKKRRRRTPQQIKTLSWEARVPITRRSGWSNHRLWKPGCMSHRYSRTRCTTHWRARPTRWIPSYRKYAQFLRRQYWLMGTHRQVTNQHWAWLTNWPTRSEWTNFVQRRQSKYGQQSQRTSKFYKSKWRLEESR